MSSSFMRSSQQRIVSGGETIPGTPGLPTKSQPGAIAASYSSHHQLKQQIRNIKAAGNPLASPSSQHKHSALRNNFIDPPASTKHYGGQHQTSLLHHSTSMASGPSTAHTGGEPLRKTTAQQKIYEQQRKL